ncbi:hypothetical protein [Bradyrhizobium australiense]|uniref:DUF2946 domain-containing protein n=1 Tax=Bradyrhizobium australiense TaxID=2721161 RepID=A0A7Y4GYN7_9BRAD|nr:hypothetical protein [Bradyrhizobium australiense]NOJ44405.1 hypothetical protein [Bradyrhizobium australiense]
MFVRLTRPARVKAGWFAALLYLFCVLAPGVALALGDAASCLVIGIQPVAASHPHDHAEHAAAAAHQHHQAHESHHADAGDTQHEPAKHGHDESSPGPCCAMLCVSGIAADLPTVVKPSQPISVCVSENSWRLPGEAPPLHYRPPIA